MMQWAGVGHADVDRALSDPGVLPLVEKILELSDMDLSWARGRLLSGELQLWLFGLDTVVNMAVLTMIEARPKKKVLVLWGAAGSHAAELLPLLDPVLLSWGRQQGCTAVECTGRFGWERFLGWPKTHVVLRKEI